MQKKLQDLHISYERIEYENISILVEERGDAFPASPSLDAWFSLNIYLGCLGHPQAWALASLPFPHIETSSIRHFTHTKLQQKTQ